MASHNEAYASGLVLPREEAMARSGRLAEFQLLEEGAQLDDFDKIVVGLDAEEVRFLESQNEMKYEEDLHKRREIQAYMSEVANNVVKAGELSPAEEYFINQQKLLAQRRKEAAEKKNRGKKRLLKIVPSNKRGGESLEKEGSAKRLKTDSDVIIHTRLTPSETNEPPEEKKEEVKDGENEIVMNAGGLSGLLGY